jgi:hypothetical protein
MRGCLKSVLEVFLEFVAGFVLAAMAYLVAAMVLTIAIDTERAGAVLAIFTAGPVGCAIGIAVVVRLFKKKIGLIAIGSSLACYIVTMFVLVKWFILLSINLPDWMLSNTVVMMVWPVVVAVVVYNIGVLLRTPGKRNTEK